MARHSGSSFAKSHHDTSRCTNYPLNTASSRQFALGFRTEDLTDAIEFPILQILHPYVAESIELFDGLTSEEKSRVIFIHMNHTNPLLIDGSPEQAEVERHGFRFAHEGMRLEL